MLIHVQFLLKWYIVIFHGINLNKSPIGLSSTEIRMKMLSPNCHSFNTLSVLDQTIRSLCNSAYFKNNALFTILIAVWNLKVFLIPWYTHPILRKYIRDNKKP